MKDGRTYVLEIEWNLLRREYIVEGSRGNSEFIEDNVENPTN